VAEVQATVSTAVEVRDLRTSNNAGAGGGSQGRDQGKGPSRGDGDAQYQRIVELVRGAASSKAPLVRLADRYALPFTAVSLGIAGLAWALSGDPVRFAEVLVVATPCPLLIAAPVAFMGWCQWLRL
jgi:hypothetical protein